MNEDKRNLNSSSQLPPNADRDAALALVAAYCLGATDPEESRLVESKAAQYPEVAAELTEYKRLSEAILYSAPVVAPPPQLFNRIMAAASADTDTKSVPMPAQPTPAQKAPTPSPIQQVSKPRLSFARLSPVLAAAAVLLLVISNVVWFNQVNQLRSEQQALNARVTEQNTLLQALGARESNRVELVSEPAGQDTYASVLWGPTHQDTSWAVLVYAKNFPVLASDQVYQLWLIRGDQRISAGVFAVDTNGEALYRFESDQPIGKFEKLGITTEPAGGSPEPTSPPLVVGKI